MTLHQHYLGPLFAPHAIAVFGASTRHNAVGAIVYDNLLSNGYAGPVFPINPKHVTLGGHKCYAQLRDLPETVDLAVIATPARTVADILADCGTNGVKHAIIMTAGFREAGAAGKALEQTMLDTARRYGIRLIGPNCLGVLRPDVGLNATFSRGSARVGRLAFVSQSGALCTAILDWAAPRRIGFSAVISLGNAADIDFGEVLDYLAFDAHTDSILLYVEGIRDARSFLSSLRAAARLKPVIVLKAGRHQAGTRAAVTHTGALVGADDVFDAAIRRAGAVRAYTIGELFAAASLLASGLRAHGNRLAVISNGGGPAVMAVDRAPEVGVELATPSTATLAALDAFLPPHWSHANPVDLLGDAPPERYGQALELCLRDEQIDGALVILTPQAMTEPQRAAQSVVATRAQYPNKPVITCWMGDAQVSGAWEIFAAAKIPHFRTPEHAVEAFALLCAYEHNQALLLQTPPPLSAAHAPDSAAVRRIIDAALRDGANVLTAFEAKAILAAFGISTTAARVADNADDAVAAALAIGFPVAMKIHHRQLTHKTDVDGVRLHIGDADAAARAYRELIASANAAAPELTVRSVTVETMIRSNNARELLIGVTRDPIFGPAITFGAGGIAVEIMRDRAVTLPPLNRFLAQRLIQHTRVATLLGPFRRLPAANLAAVEDVLLRISDLVCEFPELHELDINPLLADDRGAVVVDARMVIAHVTPGARPYAHVAIHPYPARLLTTFALDDGTSVTLRPIRPEDASIAHTFIARLSQATKQLRFMQFLQELTPAMLTRFTQIDYHREMALVAVVTQNGQDVEVAIGRFSTQPDGRSCEFALVVADDWQHRGIGRRLLTELIAIARERGLQRIEGEVPAGNSDMMNFVTTLGFTLDETSPSADSRRVWRAL